jgi:KaiC/GvpD/RAD55 family RecA-like ATPase
MPEVLRFGILSLDELFGVPSETSKQALPAGIYLPSAMNEEPNANGALAADTYKGVPTTSVCIVGPTGTGKSIFALHMASTYLSDCRAEKGRSKQSGKRISLPTVLYVSTDLTHNMAQRAWSNFGLNRPGQRREPFVSQTRREKRDVTEIRLKECDPISLAKQFRITETEKDHVIFLDMAGYTAGDDWGFLHKVLSLLPAPEDNDPRHLVIVDAIEGFEALAGKLNAFGEKSTRRSRIAQVMRLIASKCHVLLVVEQGDGGVRGATLDEEFVADTVIRLDSSSTRNYERRVLKVEKCRGQSHIRGQHHYSIRSGKGSTTGEQMNPDDPKVPAYSPPPKKTAATETAAEAANERRRTADDDEENSLANVEPADDRTQSYVQVFHSVHRISRKIMEDRTESAENPRARPRDRYAAFGIKYLDNMLGGKSEFTKRQTVQTPYEFDYDTRGLPCGSTTALVGDSLTQKSRLGKAFLSRCFYSFDERLSYVWRSLDNILRDPVPAEDLVRRIASKVSLTGKSSTDISDTCRTLLTLRRIPELVNYLESVVGEQSIISRATRDKYPDDERHLLTNLASWMLNYKGGVGVMLATQNIDVDTLATDFIDWLHSKDERKKLAVRIPGYENALRNYIKRGTVCRRLEIHSLSSEVLVHIVKQCIRDAQKKIMTPEEVDNHSLRHRSSWPVRVVIDDFSSLRNMFPELHEDPLLFPSIVFHLEREGVTTLIIDTQSGKPETTVVEKFETELRQMVDHRLYTWRVPFYGESRVAITAIPPLSHEYAGIVRELRWETELAEGVSGEPAIVDPHFELYSGLEESKPEPVPLQIRLYVDTPAMEKYVEVENAFLSEIFSRYSRPEDAGGTSVIVGVPASEYSDLRSFAYLQRDTRFDYSYVLEVDEFWLMRPPGRHKRAGAFQPQWSYLDAVTASAGDDAQRAENFQANVHADPYELFQLRNQDPSPKAINGKLSSELRRRHFYEKYYDDFEQYEKFETGTKEEFHLDRVPFSWDFGFLLCQQSAWSNNTRALYQKLANGTLQEFSTVRDVWSSLVKAQYDAPETANDYISWRVFAEACKKAAEEQSAMSSKRVTAFDFAQVSPESFSCLILEMWLSQIYDSLTKRADVLQSGPEEGRRPEEARNLVKERDDLVDAVNKRKLFMPVDQRNNKRPHVYSLLTLLEQYWLELYITWLLLIEIIDFPTVIGDATVSTFDFTSKNTDFCAVASRHWYKTATQCPDEIAAREPLVPARLPGRFAIRGDWFLAVSGGSRSIRQAERALDLLSSRRANVTRLQMGVGLPTRVPRPDGHGALFTKLISHQRGQDNLEYKTFLKIAANAAGDHEFFWLWRSSLNGYAQCNRIWHRWLNRTLLWWHRKLLRYRSAWINSFNVCDVFLNEPELSREKFAPTREQLDKMRAVGGESKELGQYLAAHSSAQLSIRVEFLELLNGLKEELQQVSNKSGT